MAKQAAENKTAIDGLFPLLRELRTRAGLTQQQIAEATGAGGAHGRKLIARLEAGHVQNPSIRLVLSYLCACKATSEDLTEFLDGYFGSPMPVPTRPIRGPRIPKPRPEDLALLALRKEAAWWNLRRVIEVMLHHELNGLKAKPMSKERKTVADYGRKVFKILYQTRQLRPVLRERRLKRCRAWAERKVVQADVIDYLGRVVTELFNDMETKGELDWLPPTEEAKHLMLLSPRHRIETDYDLCRTEWMARAAKEHEAREEARKPVIEAALAMLRSSGVTGNRIGNYQGIINAFLNVAEATQPGTAARERIIRDIVSGHQQSYIDQALLHRLAELVFSLRA
ncbi:helix-turn-helix domain-containing protein [candidate division WOR-3 bacterium]|uniref:Helix-turn-helix domain-containing protein n=1 Tax=candidate division WOR-3 bacterium TaxID=2052148 RepID=A0A938BQ11_UNCW3|nr:helix-turn-helix domain-containing protein [candidate division WOR-3 bacterium]